MLAQGNGMNSVGSLDMTILAAEIAIIGVKKMSPRWAQKNIYRYDDLLIVESIPIQTHIDQILMLEILILLS